ncbi:MFS general substrate transporter [Gonapodya prolifera JEL478]|uniref:MFS general substrate transporter n=1 Tax=Gonapodya prolifera (strain JEL478) TaxID=1344416 RepID=A0A139A7S5_GONPJ|nr:MFS general substrate transporter [Gonapodya prolifera JEL478]|eukprot:KXS12728.1 MFS general substrate transporter [Gonapodya prolifera JEL478]
MASSNPENGCSIDSAPSDGEQLVSSAEAVRVERFTERKKAVIIAVASLATTLYFLEPLPDIQESLNTTDIMGNLTVTVYSLSSAIMPIIWASISDRYGRRPVYIWTNVVCLVAAICIGLRFLQGAGTSSAFSILAGTISDLYPIHQRGRAYGYSSVGTVLGAVMGPAVGGLITDSLGWRNLFTFVAEATGLEIILLYFFVPETLVRNKTILVQSEQPAALPTSNGKARPAPDPTVLDNILRVLKTLKVLRYPFVATIVYSRVPRWIRSGALADIDIERSARRHNGQLRPEDRLWQAAFGLATLMTGLVMVGWCYDFAVNYRIPNTVAFTIIGFGGAMSLNPAGTYIIDIFPDEAATVSFISYMLRNLVASIAPAVASLIEEKGGIGWQYTTWALGIFSACIGMLWTTQRGYHVRTSHEEWSRPSSSVVVKFNDETVLKARMDTPSLSEGSKTIRNLTVPGTDKSDQTLGGTETD